MLSALLFPQFYHHIIPAPRTGTLKHFWRSHISFPYIRSISQKLLANWSLDSCSLQLCPSWKQLLKIYLTFQVILMMISVVRRTINHSISYHDPRVKMMKTNHAHWMKSYKKHLSWVWWCSSIFLRSYAVSSLDSSLVILVILYRRTNSIRLYQTISILLMTIETIISGNEQQKYRLKDLPMLGCFTCSTKAR